MKEVDKRVMFVEGNPWKFLILEKMFFYEECSLCECGGQEGEEEKVYLRENVGCQYQNRVCR